MQAEDRVRRIGQSANVVESVWVSGFELDNKLDSMLLKKLHRSEKVLANNDDSNAAEEVKWFKESQADLLKAILSDPKEKSRKQIDTIKSSDCGAAVSIQQQKRADIRKFMVLTQSSP